MILFKWRWSFLFSIILPILVVLNFIQLLFFLFKRKKQLFLNIVSLVLFFFFFDFFYQFNFSVKEKQVENSVTILSFNAHWSKFGNRNIEDKDKKIVGFVEQNNPDVICFQEFSAIKYHLFKKDYPYWVKTNLMVPKQKSVLAVFSKYPIVNKGYVEFLESKNNTMYVDIEINDEIVRVYNVHLESNRVSDLLRLKGMNNRKLLISRLFENDKKRTEQAHIVKEHLEEFNGKVMVVGDFNCTQYSSAYHVLKSSRKDTFVKAGKGFGGTYELFNYPFKIDHILVDDEIEVVNHQNFNIKLSDHEPILAEVKL